MVCTGRQQEYQIRDKNKLSKTGPATLPLNKQEHDVTCKACHQLRCPSGEPSRIVMWSMSVQLRCYQRHQG